MKIEFQSVDSIPLNITREAVIKAFSPFICPDAARVKRISAVIQIWSKAVKRVTRRLLGTHNTSSVRNNNLIKDEYEVTWARGYSTYDLSLGCQKPEPWLVSDTLVMADRSGVPRFRNVILEAAIRQLAPRRVLEVGCGNGINLFLLANQFPDVCFTGLELTEAGNRVARELQKHDILPPHLSCYAVAPGIDLRAFQRINFVQGDATNMPFEDASFDLVFTVLSVEQMEQARDKALAEIARVSAGHVLNMEPFAEANTTLLRRAHIFGRDYFRGKIEDMNQYGLNPIWATVDFPQEIQLQAALVLCKKNS